MENSRRLWLAVLFICTVIQGALYFSASAYFHLEDVYFHLARIEGIASGLAAGNFPVWINSFLLDGYGVPEGIMYPDTLLYLPALLRMAGLPLSLVYNVYWLGITFLGMYACYFVYSRWTCSAMAGCAAAVLYNSCYFQLFCHGFSAGACAAMAVFPLAVFGLWSVLRGDASLWYLAVIALCIICQSHVISVLLVCVMAVFMLARYGGSLREPGRRRAFLLLAGFGFLLNAWRLVPLLDFYPRMMFHINDAAHYFEGKLATLNYMTFTLPEMLHNSFLWGWPLVSLTGFFFVYRLCRRDCTGGWYATLFLCGIISLGMWRGFPWQLLEGLPLLGWLLPKFQFSMRFIHLALVPLVYYLGRYTAELAGCLRYGRWWLAIGCVLVSCWSLYMNATMQPEMRGGSGNKGSEYLFMESIPSTGIYNYEDYLYADVSFGDLRNRQGLPRGAGDIYTDAEVIQFVRQDSRLSLVYGSDRETYAELPVFFYHGYRGELEDGSPARLGETPEHIMTASLPAGRHTLKVWYQGPWYYDASCLLSLCGFCLFVLCLRRKGGR